MTSTAFADPLQQAVQIAKHVEQICRTHDAKPAEGAMLLLIAAALITRLHGKPLPMADRTAALTTATTAAAVAVEELLAPAAGGRLQ